MDFVFVKLGQVEMPSIFVCLSVAPLDTQAPFTEVHSGIFQQCCACCGMCLKWPTM